MYIYIVNTCIYNLFIVNPKYIYLIIIEQFSCKTIIIVYISDANVFFNRDKNRKIKVENYNWHQSETFNWIIKLK